MKETELKLQIPPGRLSAVRRAMTTRTARQVALEAVYFDTADRALARARAALRIRREGKAWVQTAKALGADAMTRLEHAVVLPARPRPAATPELALHAPHAELSQRLSAALAGGTAVLGPTYSTMVERTVRQVRQGGAMVELALDIGSIEAGSASVPIHEIEFELVSGPAEALVSLTRQWATRHGLWLDIRSKAQRGDHLAQGAPPWPSAKATGVHLVPEQRLEEALAAGLHSCLEQVMANVAVLADGDEARPEHVHQCRVGLRRLRTLLAVFADPTPATEALATTAAALFGRLGGTRDRDVLAALIAGPMHQAGYEAPVLSAVGAGAPDVGVVARDPAVTAFLLDGLALCLSLTEPPAGASLPAADVSVDAASEPADAALPPLALRPWTSRALKREYKRFRRGAEVFHQLDVEAQHRVRKRAKRLRYAMEFCASLYPGKRVERFLRRLAVAQDMMGAYTDVLMGEDLLRREPRDDPGIAFARGWLAGRREAALAACRSPLREFLRVDPPWV
jgi:triphosphatase